MRDQLPGINARALYGTSSGWGLTHEQWLAYARLQRAYGIGSTEGTR